MDPTTSLGLSSDCIASYCIGDVIRAHSLEVPELLPCGYLVGDNNIITVNLKGKNPRPNHRKVKKLKLQGKKKETKK